MVFNVACDEVGFIGNAYAAHLSQVDNGWQAISLKNSLGQGYFYFNAATFTSLGAHSSPFVPTTGTLTISAVPEPSTWMSLMLGLPLIWAGLRRRKARAGAQ